MAKNDDSKLFAFLGVFLPLIGFLIVLLAKKKDRYAMFYAKQGFVLFLVWVAAMIVSWILVFIPVLGWLLNFLIWIGLLVLWIIGLVYSLSGKEKEIPVVGQFAKKFNF